MGGGGLYDRYVKRLTTVAGSQELTVQYTIYMYRVTRHFCGLASFCVLRELTFAIWTDWFFLLGINLCGFQKVPSIQH